MDFSSMGAYLDASNWQQTPPPPPQNHHGGIIINPSNPSPLLPPPPLPPPQHHTHPPAHAASMGLGGSIRPGSMAERARMANIPMPVTAVKCPRCDSTNTKFCYYNNYSLSQPRHFCKTCRRYWTNGGALRNVPVGGGCRRNKRSKSSSSASSSKSAGNHRSTSSAATATSSANSAPPSSVAEILGLTPPPPLRFMSPLHHQLGDFIGSGELGLSSYGGVSGTGGAEFHLGSATGVAEQWRSPPPPQFPFLGGLDAAAGGSLYGHPFELPNLGIGQSLRPKPSDTGAVGAAAAAPPVKPEENGRDMSLMRQFMHQGNGGAGEQYNWGGGGGGNNGWNEISGLNNSSCSNTSGM